MVQPERQQDSLKVLSYRVLECNRQRNNSATSTHGGSATFAAKNTPKVALSCTADFPCGDCLYFGWDGLKKYCRHPKHGRLITGPGCRGKDHVDRYAKLLPTATPDYPAPLPLPERI